MNGWYFAGSVALVLNVQYLIALVVFRNVSNSQTSPKLTLGFTLAHLLSLCCGGWVYGLAIGGFAPAPCGAGECFRPLPFYLTTGASAVVCSLLYGVLHRRKERVRRDDEAQKAKPQDNHREPPDSLDPDLD
jgi:hypothetical protein